MIGQFGIFAVALESYWLWKFSDHFFPHSSHSWFHPMTNDCKREKPESLVTHIQFERIRAFSDHFPPLPSTRYWHKILVQPQLLSQNAWYTFRGMYEVMNHRRGTSTQAATPTAFSVLVQVRLELYILSLVFSNLFSNRLRHPCPVPVFYACTLYEYYETTALSS
jgi:hypothetical protein